MFIKDWSGENAGEYALLSSSVMVLTDGPGDATGDRSQEMIESGDEGASSAELTEAERFGFIVVSCTRQYYRRSIKATT